MLFVGTSIIHPSTEGVFLLCNILDLLIYSYINYLLRREKYMKFLQKLGKALMLPVAVLPICGILMGIG